MSKKPQQPASSAQQLDSLFDFYASAFKKEELDQIAEQLGESQLSTEMEVAIIRILIRQVLKDFGTQDPIKALPLIRQGVDAICRALRAQRVAEPAKSLDEAFVEALRDLSEELGIADQPPAANDQLNNDQPTTRLPDQLTRPRSASPSRSRRDEADEAT